MGDVVEEQKNHSKVETSEIIFGPVDAGFILRLSIDDQQVKKEKELIDAPAFVAFIPKSKEALYSFYVYRVMKNNQEWTQWEVLTPIDLLTKLEQLKLRRFAGAKLLVDTHAQEFELVKRGTGSKVSCRYCGKTCGGTDNHFSIWCDSRPRE